MTMVKGKGLKIKSDDKQNLASQSPGKVRQELESVKGMLARAVADYDNLSKRVERERRDLGKIASVGVIIKLLPVVDNLEGAQVHLKDQGLAICILEFKKVLAEEGLTEIRPEVGDKFDENTMEAIEVLPGASDNSIVEVVLTGWKYQDPASGASGMVVRHAKVKVSKSSS